MEQTTLYFKQGGSDKIYQACIEPRDTGYIVNFAFGRRGATLQSGTKTATAVDYDSAKAIYDKLVREKMAKGYTPGEDGTPYQHTDKESQTTGIHCQLLNPIGSDQIEQLLNDKEYWMQEKWDGRRLLLQKKGERITGINRLGLAVGLSQPLISSASNCPCDFIMDGEAVGDTLCVFDILQTGQKDVRSASYLERYTKLLNLISCFQHPAIHVVETAMTTSEKREMFNRLKAESREGVVFKHIMAPYTAGRPSSGGTQLKFKFCETASFIVAKVNGKRSVSLLLFSGEKIVPAGNVTIPPNQAIPEAGQIVECRYLYAFKESGAIYQPVYLGVREDIPSDECTMDQLKFKAS